MQSTKQSTTNPSVRNTIKREFKQALITEGNTDWECVVYMGKISHNRFFMDNAVSFTVIQHSKLLVSTVHTSKKIHFWFTITTWPVLAYGLIYLCRVLQPCSVVLQHRLTLKLTLDYAPWTELLVSFLAHIQLEVDMAPMTVVNR